MQEPQRCPLKARTVPREGIEREEHLIVKGPTHCTRRAQGRKSYGWGEAAVGATGEEASVERCGDGDKLSVMPNDLICRTAGYVTRTSGGVGGGAVRLLPIPIITASLGVDTIDRSADNPGHCLR
jgi:hypothetical protein